MKGTRARMVAELFEEGAGRPLPDALAAPTAFEADMLAALADLTDRSLKTHHRRMVSARARWLAGLPPPRGPGRPSHDYAAVFELFEEIQTHFQQRMPNGRRIPDAVMLRLINVLAEVKQLPSGSWEIEFKEMSVDEAMQAMDRLRTADRGSDFKKRRYIESLLTYFSRQRRGAKQAK